MQTGLTSATLTQGLYSLTSIAYDRNGNRSTKVNLVFVDTTLPSSITFLSLSQGAVYQEIPPIKILARDNTGGSGINVVNVLIQRRSDGNFAAGTVGQRSVLAAVIYGRL